MNGRHIVVTGGAGYIGSLLTARLLREGYRVTVIDNLLFGGESLLAFFSDPRFHFAKADVTERRSLRDSLPRGVPRPDAVVHLAGIVGFPACQAIGRQATWHYNVEAVRNVYEQAAGLGVERFIYASTYSVYAPSADGRPVDEDSPLQPESLYAESKLAAEAYLRVQNHPAPVIFRLATVYGLAPRTRFDLLVNQFVLDAFTRRELLIYQRGYSRSFIHVWDVARGLMLGLESPLERVRGQVYNLGSDEGNYTKDQIVAFIIKRLPEVMVEYKNLTFGGDKRDITVSFEKIRRDLGFRAERTVDDGVRELVGALKTGLIRNPYDERYRNAHFIVQ